MKTKLLFCVAVATLFFTQDILAQEVSTVLRSKEKRQMLYASIINSDAMFFEFMETTKASGRTNDGLLALNPAGTEAAAPLAGTEDNNENQLAMQQMLSLVKEFSADNPKFKKMMEEKYPAVGEMMKKEKLEL